jgi:hypothetical protein
MTCIALTDAAAAVTAVLWDMLSIVPFCRVKRSRQGLPDIPTLYYVLRWTESFLSFLTLIVHGSSLASWKKHASKQIVSRS